MFNLANILIRKIKESAICLPSIILSCNRPSTRCLILTKLLSGSICISDAPTCIASSKIESNNLATGDASSPIEFSSVAA